MIKKAKPRSWSYQDRTEMRLLMMSQKEFIALLDKLNLLSANQGF